MQLCNWLDQRADLPVKQLINFASFQLNRVNPSDSSNPVLAQRRGQEFKEIQRTLPFGGSVDVDCEIN